MILKRLISEAAKLPDLSTEVTEAQKDFEKVNIEFVEFEELEILNSIILRPYACENMHRRSVNLKSIETSFVKAKHAVTEDEEDFV